MSIRAAELPSAAMDGVGERMDRMYRLQRHIYDLTRKYYLFGRDELIDEVAQRARGPVLEIGCGTGRNLVRLAGRRTDLMLYGVDASQAMLATASAAIARAGFGGRVRLAQGFAETIDPKSAFGFDGRFGAVMFPYVLSMIPSWSAALEHALGLLAPGASLHVVDFGDQTRLPQAIRRPLVAWLALFHVTPRPELSATLERLALGAGGGIERTAIFRGYCEKLTLTSAG